VSVPVPVSVGTRYRALRNRARPSCSCSRILHISRSARWNKPIAEASGSLFGTEVLQIEHEHDARKLRSLG